MKIQKVRELRGFSQEYVGKRLNVSQQYYSKLESGKLELNEAMISRIAEILEVDKEKLLSFDSSIVFNNNNQQGGNFNAAHTINTKTSPELMDCMNKFKDSFDALMKALERKG